MQARFAILKIPSELEDEYDMALVMETCVILHNMIIADERSEATHDYNYEQSIVPESQVPLNEAPPIDEADFQVSRRVNCDDTFSGFLARHHQIRDRQKHVQLTDDLVKHLWLWRGMGDETPTEFDVVEEDDESENAP